MAQYAALDSAGALTGFWDDSLHAVIPAGAVALTPAQYAEWVYYQSARVWQGGALVPAPAPTPTPAQQAAAALAAGCQVVSASAPALDGTYPCDAAAQRRLTSIQSRINAGLGLPGGASTIDWLDTGGKAHVFTAAQFTALATAISDYAYPLELIASGTSAAVPPQPASIA